MSVTGAYDQYTWLFREPTASADKEVWMQLRRRDQQNLEKAVSAVAEKRPAAVLVEGGRCEVRLEERQLIDRYCGVPPREPRAVCRSLWQFQTRDSWLPYDEATGASIETCYTNLLTRAQGLTQAAPDSAEVTDSVDLPATSRVVKLKLTFNKQTGTWAFTAEEDASTSSWLNFGSRVAVRRGCDEIPVQEGEEEEDKLGPEVGYLFVLVHGIGEKMWREGGSGMDTKASGFRRMLHRQQLLFAGFKTAAGGTWEFSGDASAPRVKRAEVVEASWYQSVHNDELDARLQRITLDTLGQVRQIANYAIADALYYSQSGHRETILQTVAEAIEAAVARFKEHNSDFAGEVVLIGHSLGGTILFELLRNGATKGARLSFVPHTLFTLGSPTGMFLHCANDVPPPEFSLPGGTRFFNIFHPLDPVAYRLEPLLDPELVKLAPEQVRADGYMGGAHLHHHIHKYWKWASGELKEQGRRSVNVSQLRINAGERVDWVLQDDLNMIGTAGELMRALPSHAIYVESPDVAAFVHERCCCYDPDRPNSTDRLP